LKPYRVNAIVAGGLLLIGFTGIGTMFFSAPLLNDPAYLTQINAHQNQFLIGAAFLLVMGIACAGIPIALYPVLKKFNTGLALGSVGFRLIESVFSIAGVICLISLMLISQEYVKAGAPVSLYLQTSGALLVKVQAWISNVPVLLTWSIAALMYHYVFFKSRLIPRWLSVWGLIGVPFSIAGCLLVLFQVINPGETIQTVLGLPLGVQEIPLAVWLIFKGFNSSALETRVVFQN
jgi:hypothetical protein